MRTWHKAFRLMYRINRASRTAAAWHSGNVRRIGRLYERRLFYRIFARVINRLLK